jgi:hypothetical protein
VSDRFPRLAPHSGWIAAFVALWISWIPIQLLTRWYSGHFLWPPTWQSAPFWLGDLLLLPMVAARFASCAATSRRTSGHGCSTRGGGASRA